MFPLLIALVLSGADLPPDAVRGDIHYRVLPTGGVAVVGPDGQTRVVLLPGAPIARVLIDGDQLIVIEARQLATVYSLQTPGSPQPVVGEVRPGPGVAVEAATPAPVQPVAPALATATGRVTKVDGGRVVFELQAGTLKSGAHVRVVSQRLVEKPSLIDGAATKQPSNEVTAVLVVEEVAGARGMAPLGRGDFAEEGDLVLATDEALSQSLMVPRRAPFEWRFGFIVRPFLGLEATTSTGGGSKPVGLLVDAYVGWYPTFLPITVEASVAPFGVAIASSDPHYPTTFVLTAAYTTDYFEIGLGGGALLGNQGPCVQPLGTDCEVNNGVTFNQVLRLGALDGLSLTWRSSIFSRPDRFVFGVGRGELGVPLTSRLGLFGAGGGGENGWAFGELGVRTYLGGTGAKGTLLLCASLGYAAIFDGPRNERVGGPSVAFGLEWRR